MYFRTKFRPLYRVRGPIARVGRETIARLKSGLLDWQNCWYCAGCESDAPELDADTFHLLLCIVDGAAYADGTELRRAFAAACRRVEDPRRYAR